MNAKQIIERFGGIDEVARITGRTKVSVYRWSHPKEKGGCAGFIPRAAALRLLAAAPEKGVQITGADFMEV